MRVGEQECSWVKARMTVNEGERNISVVLFSRSRRSLNAVSGRSS